MWMWTPWGYSKPVTYRGQYNTNLVLIESFAADKRQRQRLGYFRAQTGKYGATSALDDTAVTFKLKRYFPKLSQP